MMNARIINALSEIYDIERLRLATVDYLATHDIDINAVAGACGSPTVTPITLLPNQRFDLPDRCAEDGVVNVKGVVIEARGEDGETVFDLVAWPIANPTDVHTLCGSAPILGLWQAFNAATYVFDYPLVIHRTPLDWLKADCQGAAIIIPDLAAQTFLDIANFGGQIGASDPAHARELKAHLVAFFSTVKIISPNPLRRVA